MHPSIPTQSCPDGPHNYLPWLQRKDGDERTPCGDLSYSLKRLSRGLASSREGARSDCMAPQAHVTDAHDMSSNGSLPSATHFTCHTPPLKQPSLFSSFSPPASLPSTHPQNPHRAHCLTKLPTSPLLPTHSPKHYSLHKAWLRSSPCLRAPHPACYRRIGLLLGTALLARGQGMYSTRRKGMQYWQAVRMHVHDPRRPLHS